MKRIKLNSIDIGILIMLVLGIAAAIFAERKLTAKDAECPITPATEADFEQSAAIGEGVFDEDLWRFETMEHQALISVGWFRDDIVAFAHSQYLMYNCGYTDDELAEFYGAENMEVMLGGYDTWEQTASCKAGDIELREYNLTLDGGDYISRFWIEPLSDTRVRDMRLDFPADQGDEMDEYAQKLYPQLASCEG
jgi:hypothetical protein